MISVCQEIALYKYYRIDLFTTSRIYGRVADEIVSDQDVYWWIWYRPTFRGRLADEIVSDRIICDKIFLEVFSSIIN